jgi:hypothetical protein
MVKAKGKYKRAPTAKYNNKQKRQRLSKKERDFVEEYGMLPMNEEEK